MRASFIVTAVIVALLAPALAAPVHSDVSDLAAPMGSGVPDGQIEQETPLAEEGSGVPDGHFEHEMPPAEQGSGMPDEPSSNARSPEEQGSAVPDGQLEHETPPAEERSGMPDEPSSNARSPAEERSGMPDEPSSNARSPEEQGSGMPDEPSSKARSPEEQGSAVLDEQFEYESPPDEEGPGVPIEPSNIARSPEEQPFLQAFEEAMSQKSTVDGISEGTKDYAREVMFAYNSLTFDERARLKKPNEVFSILEQITDRWPRYSTLGQDLQKAINGKTFVLDIQQGNEQAMSEFLAAYGSLTKGEIAHFTNPNQVNEILLQIAKHMSPSVLS